MTSPESTKAEPPEAVRRTILSRYQDAYLTARAINGIGMFVKFVGFVLGATVAFGGFLVGSNLGGGAAFAAIAIGVVSGFIIYVGGVLLSAQGQLLKATLDTAVNSSTLLTDDDRVRMMSIDSASGAPISLRSQAPDGSQAGQCANCGKELAPDAGRTSNGLRFCQECYVRAVL